MDKKEIKNSFRGLLPRGFTATIKERVKQKSGKEYSQSLISKVCDADRTNWNTDIIAEALILAKEENTVLDTLKAQAADI